MTLNTNSRQIREKNYIYSILENKTNINRFSQEPKSLESFKSQVGSSNATFKEEIISAIRNIPKEEEDTGRQG